MDRSSGRSSLHRYEACTSPGTNQTRWSAGPALSSAAACRQYGGRSTELTYRWPVQAGSVEPASTSATAAATAARGPRPGQRCHAATTPAVTRTVTPSTSTAPTLFVVRNAAANGTWSNARPSARPNGAGCATGNSPTMIGTATSSSPSPSRRSGPRTSSAPAAASTGSANEAITTTGEVR